MRVAVVMAGGSGERFWPLSRRDHPKQLLRLTSSGESLLEQSVRRIEPLVGPENVYVSTGLNLKDAIVESGAAPAERVLAEPQRRNTLGAIAWVAATLRAKHPQNWRDVVMAVVTADHAIGEPDKFRQVVDVAMTLAESEDSLVTVGIRPTRPEVGFGYVAIDETHVIHGYPVLCYRAKGFREKPSYEDAVRFFESRRYFWNSGMFFWRLGSFFDQLAEVSPEVGGQVEAVANALEESDAAAAEAAFSQLPSISIDYALMEKSHDVCMVAGDFPWEDLGSWDALERTLERDADANIVRGEVIAESVDHSILINEASGMVTCVLGLKDVVVVTTRDAVLVMHKSRAQEVRRIVDRVKESGGPL